MLKNLKKAFYPQLVKSTIYIILSKINKSAVRHCCSSPFIILSRTPWQAGWRFTERG